MSFSDFSDDGEGMLCASALFEPDTREALIEAFDDAWDDERSPPTVTDCVMRMIALNKALLEFLGWDPARVVIEVEDDFEPDGPVTEVVIQREFDKAEAAVALFFIEEEAEEELDMDRRDREAGR